MPLTVQTATADVIIHELLQPHRYAWALKCKCGFQSHGFEKADMLETGINHLSFRHGIPRSVADKLIRIPGFKTSGGEPFSVLEQKIQQEAAKGGQEAKKEVAPTPPASTATTPEPAMAARPKQTVPTAPTKPAAPPAQAATSIAAPTQSAAPSPIPTGAAK